MMVSEPAPCPKRFASVGQARTIIVESHIVAMEDTVTSDGQIACLCLSEPRFRGVPCRDSREWMTRPHYDGACWLIDSPPIPSRVPVAFHMQPQHPERVAPTGACEWSKWG